MSKVAVIAGAGPAGLTAALELLRRSSVIPIVFEADDQVGGISKTINYRGNRMDLGGHRFFSKSDWVMQWWQTILPVVGDRPDVREPIRINYHQKARDFLPTHSVPASIDAVMLVRQRLSRIFYRRRFFDYPLKLNANTLRNLGPADVLRIAFSYARARIRHHRAESSLEDFLINRFGERLYFMFFKDYTEKVWGVPCAEISAEWGAQRIKGLSISKALAHALLKPLRSAIDTAQKKTETSLIERFLYPKLGPGQMWEEVARMVATRGGRTHLRHRVIAIERVGLTIKAVTIRDERTGELRQVECDYFISTLPIRDLVNMLAPDDDRVISVACQLPYRDFITVGLLVRKMRASNASSLAGAPNGMPPDNWIYIQEPDVKIGRLQIFNNWSPALVADPATIWLGLEYFCVQGDALWSMSDPVFLDFAANELAKLGLIDREDVLDGTVVRVPNAYPAYFGEYRHFGVIREYLDRLDNLFSVGRNGMHRYNNQDHSMLSANCAVDTIVKPGAQKSKVWSVNSEDDYHEGSSE